MSCNIIQYLLTVSIVLALSSTVQAQSNIEKKSSTLVFASTNDSVFCIPIGRHFAFVLKNRSLIDTLLEVNSPYNRFNQCISVDLDKDKLNEAVVSFGDEGFYDLQVYRFRKSRNTYTIQNVFTKSNIDNPQEIKIPYLAKGESNTILFYSIDENAKIVEYELNYDNHSNSYLIRRTK